MSAKARQSMFGLQRPSVDFPAFDNTAVRNEHRSAREMCGIWIGMYRKLIAYTTRSGADRTAHISDPLTLYLPQQHTCSSKACTFVVHSSLPLYACTISGFVHICDANCNGVFYQEFTGNFVCPTTGRVYPADCREDGSYERAILRGSQMDSNGDAGCPEQYFASATVAKWRRTQALGNVRRYEREMQRRAKLFPIHVENEVSLESGQTSNPDGVSASTSRVVVTRERKTKAHSRQAPASRVDDAGTRIAVAKECKIVMHVLFPRQQFANAIETAFARMSQSYQCEEYSIPLFSTTATQTKERIEEADSKVEYASIFFWLFRYLWKLWYVLTSAPRYNELAFTYTPKMHTVAILRFLHTGYKDDGICVVPVVPWFGDNRHPINDTVGNVGYKRSSTITNVVKAQRHFMEIWTTLPNHKKNQFPSLQQTESRFSFV